MSGSDATSAGERWFGRNGWLLAATWLVFLVFPWLTILSDDDLGTAGKVGATALLVAFALVYVDGFRRLHAHEQRDARPWAQVVGRGYTGRLHLAILVAIGVALFAVVGAAGLGVLSFVVAFAAFHFRWSTAWVALVVGVGLAVLVPLATGSLHDLWFMGLITLSVGLAAMLIRGIEASQAHQADLRTQLAVSDERNRVARDVHDVLGHSLTAVILKAELCQKLLDGVEPDGAQDEATLAACSEQLGELRSVSRSALAEIRATVGGLRVADLADEVTVARTVLADAGVELVVTGDVVDVPERHRPVLAWVVREAVTNVVRHAGASHCHIELGAHPAAGEVVLRISDDGVGVDEPSRADPTGADPTGADPTGADPTGVDPTGADPTRADAAGGNGLRGVRERIEAAGGEVRLRGGDGTTLEVAL